MKQYFPNNSPKIDRIVSYQSLKRNRIEVVDATASIQCGHLIFRKPNHLVSSSKAGLYWFIIRLEAIPSFSSSVRSYISDSCSKSTSRYFGLLFLKITAQPFASAMRATREKFFVRFGNGYGHFGIKLHKEHLPLLRLSPEATESQPVNVSTSPRKHKNSSDFIR